MSSVARNVSIKVAQTSINVAGESIAKSETARNLGVILDHQLSLHDHIRNVVKVCRFQIRSIWKIRKYLMEYTTKSIVHSVIISRLNYCNALYINLPDKHLMPLQKVMKEAARLITLTPRRQHITKALIALHWLPIQKRIEFKILRSRPYTVSRLRTSVTYSKNTTQHGNYDQHRSEMSMQMNYEVYNVNNVNHSSLYM